MPADENAPVIAGVGQAMEITPRDLREASSYVDLATLAVNRALDDAGAPELSASIDAIAAVRTFEDSLPGQERAFGGPRNLPGAVAGRIAARPRELIYDKLGGHTPQRLVNEFASRCHRGDCRAALLFGVEVIANIRAARRASVELDWSEAVDGNFTDRGGPDDALELIGPEALRHGLTAAMQLYGLMETARRLHRGLDRAAYAREMGALFSPFTEVAANNPFAQFPRAMSADELSVPGPANPLLVSPYTRNLVARDGVNQAAAILVTTAGEAERLGIPANRQIHLLGSADTDELPLLERPRLDRSIALRQALRGALESAAVSTGDLAHIDLYSCFPIVVFEARDALGIAHDDPRALTQTGGLPYFGGPGNNYSMHAIAALVETLRDDPGSYGLIHANGGLQSRHSVGIYSTAPGRGWRPTMNDELQKPVSSQQRVPVRSLVEGPASVESWVVDYRRGEPERVVISGRLKGDGARFVAVNRPGDTRCVLALAEHDSGDLPVRVEPAGRCNLFELAAP